MPEDDKKLQYLKRDEVRTMEKDIARLRELEAEKARGQIAEIKTEEELTRESERIEQARIAAEERERLEAEVIQKEQELKKIKEEKAAELSAETASEEVRAEEEKEKLRSQFKEAQSKEEEERRRFLRSVSEKAGEAIPEPSLPPEPPPLRYRPEPPAIPERPFPQAPPLPAEAPSTPPETKEVQPIEIPAKKPFKFSIPSIKFPKPKIPAVHLPKIVLPKVPLPKVTGYFPGKPSLFSKIWIRIVASLFVLAILVTIATFWYWYLVIRPMPAPVPAPAPTPTAPAPQEITPAEPKIIQNLLRSGYYLPASVRVIDTIVLHSGFNTSNGDPYDLEGIVQSYKIGRVATHYLISREGTIYQLAPDYAVAYHAGAGKMPDGRTNVNSFSISISLVYKEAESPNAAQYESLGWLVKNLSKKYNISQENILGYKDIAPNKTTPWNFDWDKLKLLISSAVSSPSNGAEFILNKLTLEEKIGQLLIINFEGTSLSPDLERFIKTVRPGGVLLFKKNIESPSQIKKLTEDLQRVSLSKTGLPLFVAIDQEGGAVSRLNFIKEKTGQSEIKDANQAYKTGLNRGKELKELGINLNLAPVLDLTQAGDFLHERSFQKEAEETGILAKALALGQKAAGILTALKHFPGYGGISFNPEEELAILTSDPQTDNFQKAMEAGPEFILLASVIYSDIDSELPITFSSKGVAFLKEKLGKGPLLMTDDLAQKAFLDNFPLKETAVLPIKAGVDMLLFSDYRAGANAAPILKEAMQKGIISEETINRAVLRIIKLKQSYLNL